MATTKPIKTRLQNLKTEFDTLKKGKESLLIMVDEAEVNVRLRKSYDKKL